MMSITKNNLITCALISLILTGCSSLDRRYLFKHDSAPDESTIPTLDYIEDAVPKCEMPSSQGNKDYTINEQDYTVWHDTKQYKEVGNASWYGKKFHGHLTSNGEIYDMYSMSGAHKNLPIPSYVRVTNLANQHQVVVRVNDRGPFHEGRIIDLSYAAAYKIGLVDTGTAKVEVELIQPDECTLTPIPPAVEDEPGSMVKTVNLEAAPPPTTELVGATTPMITAPATKSVNIDTSKYFVQLIAAKDAKRVLDMAASLDKEGYTHVVAQIDGLNKLWLGPYSTQVEAERTQIKMNKGAYKDAFIISPK